MPAPDSGHLGAPRASTSREEPDGHLRFRREVVRDVAYAGLPFRVRRELHAAAARRLERDLGDDATTRPRALAVHFHRAGVHEKAWRYARLAAIARATVGVRRRGQPSTGARSSRRSQLDVPPGELADVWESLADAYVRTGELERADHALTTARRLVADDPVRTAHLLWLHARIAERAARWSARVRWSRRALRALDGVDGRSAAACRSHVVATLAAVRQRQGRTADAVRLAREAIADGGGGGRGARARARIPDPRLGAGDVGPRRGGRATPARALEIFRRHGAADRESAVLNNMGGFAYRAGRWDEAVALYRPERRRERARGRRELRRLRGLQRRRAALRPGSPGGGGAAAAARAPGLAWHRRRARRRLRHRAARAAARAPVAPTRRASCSRTRSRASRRWASRSTPRVKALLAEAALFDGRRGGARSRARAARGGLPEDAQLEPLLHHVVGVALAQMGERRGRHRRARRRARRRTRSELPFETALALDALEALDPLAAAPSRARRAARSARHRGCDRR